METRGNWKVPPEAPSKPRKKRRTPADIEAILHPISVRSVFTPDAGGRFIAREVPGFTVAPKQYTLGPDTTGIDQRYLQIKGGRYHQITANGPLVLHYGFDNRSFQLREDRVYEIIDKGSAPWWLEAQCDDGDPLAEELYPPGAYTDPVAPLVLDGLVRRPPHTEGSRLKKVVIVTALSTVGLVLQVQGRNDSYPLARAPLAQVTTTNPMGETFYINPGDGSFLINFYTSIPAGQRLTIEEAFVVWGAPESEYYGRNHFPKSAITVWIGTNAAVQRVATKW